MALVTVSGTELPTPSKYKGEVADLVDSGRNAQGYTNFNVIRHNVGKVYMEWNFLTPDEVSGILMLFKDNYVNSVRFLDVVTNTYVTREMYVQGTRDGGDAVGIGGIKGYKNVSLNLIEV